MSDFLRNQGAFAAVSTTTGGAKARVAGARVTSARMPSARVTGPQTSGRSMGGLSRFAPPARNS